MAKGNKEWLIFLILLLVLAFIVSGFYLYDNGYLLDPFHNEEKQRQQYIDAYCDGDQITKWVATPFNERTAIKRETCVPDVGCTVNEYQDWTYNDWLFTADDGYQVAYYFGQKGASTTTFVNKTQIRTFSDWLTTAAQGPPKTVASSKYTTANSLLIDEWALENVIWANEIVYNASVNYPYGSYFRWVGTDCFTGCDGYFPHSEIQLVVYEDYFDTPDNAIFHGLYAGSEFVTEHYVQYTGAAIGHRYEYLKRTILCSNETWWQYPYTPK